VRLRDAVWMDAAPTERRLGIKGPAAATVLAELGFNVPRSPNTWAPLRAADRDDSWNVVARLGTTEFFVENDGAAADLDALQAAARPGAYPVLREDFALLIGGPAAREVLARICNVNFDALPEGKPVVMTLIIGVAVLVLPQRQAHGLVYRIWCDPSYGTYLWAELEEIVTQVESEKAQ
jgi:sarcosine oxidase, subunit gamma